MNDLLIVIPGVILGNGITGSLLYLLGSVIRRATDGRAGVRFRYITIRALLLFSLLPVFGIVEATKCIVNCYYSLPCDPGLSYISLAGGILFVIWALGFILKLRQSCRNRKLAKQTMHMGSMPAELTWKRTMAVIQEMVGERRNIVIRERFGGIGAYVDGVIHPMIYVPADEYTQEQREIILVHEMIHIQEQDVLWKNLAEFCTCLYWMIPVYKFVQRQVNQLSEYNCDSRSIQFLHSSRSYFDCMEELLWSSKSMEQQHSHSEGKNGQWTPSMVKNADDLRSRIAETLHEKQLAPRRSQWILAIVTLLLFSGSITTAAVSYSYLKEARQAYWNSLTVVTENSELPYYEEYSIDFDGLTVEADVYESEQWSSISSENWVEYPDESSSFFNWNISGNSAFLSDLSYAAFGQEFVVGCVAEPEVGEVRAGIVCPNGSVHYVILNSDTVQAFAVDESGEYRLVVENCCSQVVNVGGFTMIRDS